jgi:hypothetical protein
VTILEVGVVDGYILLTSARRLHAGAEVRSSSAVYNDAKWSDGYAHARIVAGHGVSYQAQLMREPTTDRIEWELVAR